MNVLDTLGLISSSFGAWEGVEGGDRATLVDKEANRYIRLEFDGDMLVGAQCVGMTEHVGMLRGLIQTHLHLGPWKDKLMESPGRVAEAYVAVMQQTPTAGYTGLKVAYPA
jgi:NAD(P)H-nitrite reductase large subunit